MCPTQTSSFEDDELAPVVRLCALRAIEGRPLPVHLAAQAHLPSLSSEDWKDAVATLKKVLLALDGRSAKRWGLTNEQGSKFCRWKRARMETMLS